MGPLTLAVEQPEAYPSTRSRRDLRAVATGRVRRNPGQASDSAYVSLGGVVSCSTHAPVECPKWDLNLDKGFTFDLIYVSI